MKKIIIIILIFILVFVSYVRVNCDEIVDNLSYQTYIKEVDKISDDIAAEGIVLLKNTDNFLPQKNINVNVFGYASYSSIYGGSGSGRIDRNNDKVSIIEGIKNANFQVFEPLVSLYENTEDNRIFSSQEILDWSLIEPDISDYIEDAKEWSNTAFIAIGRMSGEGSDIPRDMTSVTYNGDPNFVNKHYLSLSKDEKEMVNSVCENFENVVLIYNGNNVFELGFINEYPSIKSVLWVPGAGDTGFNQLGKILNGEINPSGKTNDMFLYDLTKDITYNSFGDNKYVNMPYEVSYVNYSEGIYNGYRFYESTYAEGLDCYENVQFPFGFGLSYTSFDSFIKDMSFNGKNVQLTIETKNTGKAKGKNTIEVYLSSPYVNGGTEKSDVVLIAFDKTKTLKPRKSQIITFDINLEDFASYDENRECYVLEKGEYTISIRNNSHDIIDQSRFLLEEDIYYEQENVNNKFDFAKGEITYLSRKDNFQNLDLVMKGQNNSVISKEIKNSFSNNHVYNVWKNEPGENYPLTNEQNSISFEYMRNIEYDDEIWEYFLNQLSIEEMKELVSEGGFGTKEIQSINKKENTDADGPSSLYNSKTNEYSRGYPVMEMLANTWNRDLAYRYGDVISKTMVKMDIDGWYAPAVNLHRSAFGGRNFEYFSEDPYITGVFATEIIKSVNKNGRYTFTKHFCLNEQETNRASMLCTWVNEQTIREIYLKPFEMAVKDGKTFGIMSSFNFIGNCYTGASYNLLSEVLRDEWGFKGAVISDWFGDYGYQNADQMIRSGNDLCLDTLGFQSSITKDSVTANGQLALRNAAKNIIYMASKSYDSITEQKALCKAKLKKVSTYLLYAIASITILLIAVSFVEKHKKRKENLSP